MKAGARDAGYIRQRRSGPELIIPCHHVACEWGEIGRGRSTRMALLAQPDARSSILPDAFEERMPHFAFCGLRPVLDLGEQFRLDPDALVRDALAVRLRFAVSGVRRLRNSAAEVLSKPWSTLPA
jgi:hypothetical protein